MPQKEAEWKFFPTSIPMPRQRQPGSKRWALYPPASPFPPPGTQGRHPVPAYGADRKNWGISSPWLWHADERGAKHYFERVLPSLAEEEQPQQCMVREGELLFVPSGWAHLVLNTEASLAITENFMDESNSKAVMSELRKRPSALRTLTQRHRCSHIPDIDFARHRFSRRPMHFLPTDSM